ncbi:phospholipase [Rhodoferax koreense]|uniref:Phospholipase n=1 Tax=Rhodoferax koreensis TaxID=1842727 RepID=A0A1P8K421_9BURK|nr:phospholipase [Rhodoferax koreense]
MLSSWLPSLSQHFLFGALAVLAYVITTRSRREPRAPTTAIAWVMGLALLPYLILPMYLMFGRRKVRPAQQPRPRRTVAAAHWASDLIESFDLAPPSLCDIHLHADGLAARDGLWDTIASARQRLDVCTFIIGKDALGSETVARLAQRAREGIQVRVLLDGFGAMQLPRRYFDTLREAGGEVAVFRPLFSLRVTGPRNLRNHRKLVVADDRLLWSGGRNLAGEYFLGKDDGEPPWIDVSYTIRGGVAAAAAHQFEQDWASVRQKPPRSIAAVHELHHGKAAQFLPSGPDQVEDTAHALLIDACFRAERRILAVTPYFIPDDSLRDALRLAARRGVEVTLIIPARSNHRLADFARTRAMRDLAAAGVAFVMLPFMAHAKALVVDDSLALCGSINLDLRSLLLNHEAAVVFYATADIAWLADWLQALAAKGAPYAPRPPGLLRDVAEGLLLTVAFQL